MRCTKIKRLISRYIDKELIDGKTMGLIEGHLKECTLCKAEQDFLIKIKGLISEKEKLSAGEDFLARLKESLNPPAQAVELKWVVETGNLARRLIPVPVTITLLVMYLLFARYNGLNPIEDYIFADLNSREITIVSEDIEETNLLNESAP